MATKEYKESLASRKQDLVLPVIPPAPRPCLTNDALTAQWAQSPGFQLFWAWIKRRCERIKGKDIQVGPYHGNVHSIKCIMDMLDTMTEWVKEAPPDPRENQRFGNLAFRKYNKIIQARLPTLIDTWNLPRHLFSQLVPLWVNSYAFGHPVRLDYGTGHELAFMLGLWACILPGWIGGEGLKEEEEDDTVLCIFPRYLELMTLLQKTYNLEPAGSHGVWGLDDYCFLPYLFGSAQLLDSPLTPSDSLALALAHHPSASPDTSPPAIKDLYTLSLHHLTLFKSGAAFSEHSPLLYSLSQMPSWAKPYAGLQKMFLGEVVGKKVVVQGLWVGGWAWGADVPEVDEKRGEVKKVMHNGVTKGKTIEVDTKAPKAPLA